MKNKSNPTTIKDILERKFGNLDVGNGITLIKKNLGDKNKMKFMKTIKQITILLLVILLGLLVFEMYRNWDDSYQHDNSISIILYSVFSVLVFVFYLLIPKFYRLIKPYINDNKDVSVNDKFINLQETNKTKHVIFICFSAIICCLIIGYSYFISNRYVVSDGGYRVVDKYNNTYVEPDLKQ